MNELFKKPAGMRWVDMAIYIDNNIYKEDVDMNTIFKYMYLLAFMLTSKAKYFSKAEDYDNFAYYLAYETFVRMTDPDKGKIKSVLNYMRSIMYFRKMAYNNENFSEVIDPEFNKSWDGDKYKELSINNLNSVNSEIVRYNVIDTLKSIPAIVRKNIPKVYKSDKLLYNNLYTSVILSLLNIVTLPEIRQDYLVDSSDSVTFDDVNYIRKYTDDKNIIMWHLSTDMEEVVRLTLNKVKNNLVKDIGEIVSDYRVTDDMFDNMYTDLIYGDVNNE